MWQDYLLYRRWGIVLLTIGCLAISGARALEPTTLCPDCEDCESARAAAWETYAQGEYVGHERIPHVPEYRLRVDDELELVYRLTRQQTSGPYKLNVGDRIRIESFADPTLDRKSIVIQPDGHITLRLLGQVRAAGRTVDRLRKTLNKAYKKYYRKPSITVTPLRMNTRLEDLRATVDTRHGAGGQNRSARVTPEGTISLPMLGSVPAQGLTLAELRQELNARYREQIEGIEVVPVLTRRAPRFAYVLGEVARPGRFELTGPTTLLQALSMAGSWNPGANLRQIVVFRRGDDWCLMGAMFDLHATLHGKQLCPTGEIWLNDSDVIVVPKRRIIAVTDFTDRVFTRGILPIHAHDSFFGLDTL